MNVRRLVMCLLLALPVCAVAQTTDPAKTDPAKTDPATRELIEKLLTRIDTLEKRVAQLENPGMRPTAPAAPVVPALPTAAHAHDTAPVPDAAQPSYPSLKLAGF